MTNENAALAADGARLLDTKAEWASLLKWMDQVEPEPGTLIPEVVAKFADRLEAALALATAGFSDSTSTPTRQTRIEGCRLHRASSRLRRA